MTGDREAGAAAPPPAKKRPAMPGAGRPCTVCRHERRAEIDGQIIAGRPDEQIAGIFGIKTNAVWRHRRKHVPTPSMEAAIAERAEAEAEHGIDLLEKAGGLLRAAEDMLREARADGDRVNAIRAVREAGRIVEILARLNGTISDTMTLNVLVSPALVSLQTIVLQALAQHPDARASVMRALASFNGTPLIEHSA